MKKFLKYHLQVFLSSALLGVILFVIAVYIHPVLGIKPLGVKFYDQIEVSELDLAIDTQVLLKLVNEYREGNQKKPLTYDPRLCTAAQEAVKQIEADQELGSILQLCPDCFNLTVLTLKGTYSEEDILNSWKEQQSAALLEDSSVACVERFTNTVAITIGNLNRTAAKVSIDKPSSEYLPNMRNIPDQEVIDALNAYRGSHNVPALVVNQDLCSYAEKRTRDLVAYGGLDGHEGFRKDFEGDNVPPELSNYPGRGIGENLAHQYCYRGDRNVIANTGTALIEWCFDSSTSGHREAQLNPKYTAGCVRHAQNMYVVIFGE